MVARHDQTTDPELQEALLQVRRGTSFYNRKLNELSDADFDAPSRLPAWSRRQLIAHVGYNARAITRLVQWANTGVETPMYESPTARAEEIAFGSTLPVRALRHLNDHAAISLNVEWRDTPDASWRAEVRTAQGRTVPLSETVWMRTREVWLHAIDLDNGARFAEIPREVLRGLLADILGFWERKGTSPEVSIRVTDEPQLGVDAPGAAPAVVGELPAIVAWASGRGGHLLDEGVDVVAPGWL
ncbi:MAG: maleylpyruvate isomerase family mycothiol-dependent enzyme [Pseudoclavibacter sp.]